MTNWLRQKYALLRANLWKRKSWNWKSRTSEERKVWGEKKRSRRVRIEMSYRNRVIEVGEVKRTNKTRVIEHKME